MKPLLALLILTACSSDPTTPTKQSSTAVAPCIIPAPQPGDVSIWICITVAGHRK